jgi:hypothetical protein
VDPRRGGRTVRGGRFELFLETATVHMELGQPLLPRTEGRAAGAAAALARKGEKRAPRRKIREAKKTHKEIAAASTAVPRRVGERPSSSGGRRQVGMRVTRRLPFVHLCRRARRGRPPLPSPVLPPLGTCPCALCWRLAGPNWQTRGQWCSTIHRTERGESAASRSSSNSGDECLSALSARLCCLADTRLRARDSLLLSLSLSQLFAPLVFASSTGPLLTFGASQMQ